jgi:hypothetical protein
MTEVALCESLLAKGLTGGCQYAQCLAVIGLETRTLMEAIHVGGSL